MGKESGLPSEIQIVSLIDDWKPYQAAKEAGFKPSISLSALRLYEEISFERLLEA